MKLKSIILLTCLAVAVIPIGIIAGFEGLPIKSSLISIIAVVTIAVSLIMANLIAKPIEQLTSKIDSISKGKLDVHLSKSEIHEINDLTISLSRVMASLKLAAYKIGTYKESVHGHSIERNIKSETLAVPSLKDRWSEKEFDSVFFSDEKANIIDCNQNMYEGLGYSKPEMLSLNIADFDALESKEEILDKLKEAKKNGSTSFKTIHKRKDGSAVLVYENLQYLKDKNTIKVIVREDYSLKKDK